MNSGSMLALADEMRAAGARRVRLSETETATGTRAIIELELLDTIPAPPSFETMPTDFPPAEQRAPGLCEGIGCPNPSGWQGTAYCRAHGLAAAGVKR